MELTKPLLAKFWIENVNHTLTSTRYINLCYVSVRVYRDQG